MTNTLAYYENPLFTVKKSFITFGPGLSAKKMQSYSENYSALCYALNQRLK